MNGRILSRPFLGRERQSAFCLSFLGAAAIHVLAPFSFLPFFPAAALILICVLFRPKAFRVLLFAAAGFILAGISFASAPLWEKAGEAIGNSVFADGVVWLRERFSEAFGALEEGPLFRAILLGGSKTLSAETAEAFRVTGTRHLLALSGVHVSVVLGFFSLFPAGRRKNLLLSLSALGYLVLAGFTVSVTRSVLMALFTYLGAWARQKNDPVNALFLSAVVFLFFDPGALTEAGFLLTFFATLGILVFARPVLSLFTRVLSANARTVEKTLLLRLALRIAGAFVVTLAAQTAVFPVTVLCFREVSCFSPLYNLFLVPFLTLLLAAGILYLLCFEIGIGAPFGAAADLLAKGFLAAVRFFAGAGGYFTVSGTAALAGAVSFAVFLAAFLLLLRRRAVFFPFLLPASLLALFLWSLVFPV